jgi:hypothetical protein
VLVGFKEDFNQFDFLELEFKFLFKEVLDKFRSVNEIARPLEMALHGESTSTDTSVFVAVDEVRSNFDHFFFKRDHIL